MSSYTSSSDPAEAQERSAWRRFFLRAVATAAAGVAVVYAFVVLVDPWGVLPFDFAQKRFSGFYGFKRFKRGCAAHNNQECRRV